MVGDGEMMRRYLPSCQYLNRTMAGAADLAQVSSDPGAQWSNQTVAKAREVAFKTDRIIAQNFKWAPGIILSY